MSTTLPKSCNSQIQTLESEKSDKERLNLDNYRKAITVVLTQRIASISLIQRHLRLGYSDAKNIMKKMMDEGIVSRDLQADGLRQVIVRDID